MIKISALILTAAVLACNGFPYSEIFQEEWDLFKLKHGKQYASPVEEKLRMNIFAQQKLKVAEHNQLFHEGKETYLIEVNEFADMLRTEVIKSRNGLKSNKNKYSNYEAVTFIAPDDDIQLPESMNWTSKGAVTPVKNQGYCGSCWAFSATGSLEGQHFRKTGKLVSLSEQNLVDCSFKEGNDGCGGGLMETAFTYVKHNGGVDTEASYPYNGLDEKCHFNPNTIGATDSGFVEIPKGNELALKKAVATIGPISVGIDASHSSFSAYKSGIYQDKDCDPKFLDHGVLVVGYGTENGVDYWLVKNSWGPKWGDNGYIKMIRNFNNQCGIASKASYPLV